MSINLRAGVSNDGAVQIGNTDIIAVTSAGAGPATGKTLEATSGPSGSAFGFRNKIINGGMQVAQRGTNSILPAANTPTYGGCDRFFGMHSNASGFTLSQASGQPTTSGNMQQLTLTTAASGNAYFGQNIEAANSTSCAGKTVTISAKVWHNVGSNVNVTIRPARANSSDNFSATAAYTPSGAFSVATSTYTTITHTVTLDANASNGIQVVFDFSFTGALSGKGFLIGDVQLTEGSNQNEPFESRPVGVELALCQRYFEAQGGNHATEYFGDGSANSTTSGYILIYYSQKRASPTISISSASHFQCLNNIESGASLTSLTFDFYGDMTARCAVTGSSSLVTGSPIKLAANSSLSARLYISSEL